MTALTAVEFFSGIGSFADACRNSDIRVIAAFDQNPVANQVYAHNFKKAPRNVNLDSIKLEQIPEADIWWMSPPCTPYSVRGRKEDIKDPRAKSFLRLLESLKIKRPPLFFLENVSGFERSMGHKLLLDTLFDQHYKVVETNICATDFGTPMRRPRHFVVAYLEGALQAESAFTLDPKTEPNPRQPLSRFLERQYDERLVMPEAEFKKYEAAINVIDADDASANCICFTKGYYRCRLASGSLLRLPDGRVRRFSSREILRLLGFSDDYEFPEALTEEKAAGLLGNAVDVRAVKYLLRKTGSLD